MSQLELVQNVRWGHLDENEKEPSCVREKSLGPLSLLAHRRERREEARKTVHSTAFNSIHKAETHEFIGAGRRCVRVQELFDMHIDIAL